MFWVKRKHHCLMLLCIDNFSFILCSCSCIVCWKWGQPASNPLLPSHCCKKKKRGKKGRGWHIKKASTCNSFSVSLILCLFLIFKDKRALKPLVKWVHYLGLLTRIHAFEHIFRGSSQRACDPYWFRMVLKGSGREIKTNKEACFLL